MNSLPIFRGRRRQHGYGIGGLFSSLFRSAIPLLKKGAVAVGKEALKTGAHVMNDVIQGRNGGEALRERSLDSVKKLGKKAVHKVIKPKTSHPVIIPAEAVIASTRKRKKQSRSSKRKKAKHSDIFG